ncbi:MAG: GxxExxY protein [Caldilineaceae bacterium]|nr:GxxExxY protein [Caldilineaceae bacterium]
MARFLKEGNVKHSELTGQIHNAFYKVYNALGYGFMEKVYENAMLVELRRRGLKADSQRPITVYYEGISVGDYYADIVVENLIILELKSADKIHDNHLAQLVNYLRATDCEVGLLLNFGPEPETKRRILDNPLKPGNRPPAK